MSKATLDDVPLLASGDVTWSLTPGVEPNIGRFHVTPRDAQRLMTRGEQPVTLTIDDGGKNVQFRHLYVLGTEPGPDEHVEIVVVADQRVWWPYQHVTRRYNVRRRVGVRRLIKDGTAEMRPVGPEIQYAPWSLPGGDRDAEPWTARDVLADVMAEVAGSVPQDPGPPLHASSLDTLMDALPIENLELDDPGHDSVQRAMAQLPEVDVTIDVDGRVTFFSKVDRYEVRLTERVIEYEGHGHLTINDNRLVRPREVHVLFTRESEIRVDAEELERGQTTDRDPESRYMENVVPLPDYELEVDGELLTRGTYVEITKLLKAWGKAPRIGEITPRLLRIASVPFVDLWGAIEVFGRRDPDQDWSARIAALQAHYRRTYRINPRWTDRVLEFNAYRVATIDPAFGTRAPAPCYTDYAVIPGFRWWWRDAKNTDLTWAINVKGAIRGARITSRNDLAPVDVVILDHDQGILHMNWRIDPQRGFQQVLPSLISYDGDNDVRIPGPMGDLSNKQRSITFDTVGAQGELPSLAGNHKLSCIISAIPASPNDDRQLQRVVVRPEDVQELLPPDTYEAVREASGPIMEVRIDASMETARIAWSDDQAGLIDQAFGILGVPGQGGDVSVELEPLIVNFGAQQDVAPGSNAASLTAISKAAAATVWASFADKAIGQAAGELERSLSRVRGNIGSIDYFVQPNGAVGQRYVMPPDPPAFNMLSLMPPSTRRLLMRIANPGRKA